MERYAKLAAFAVAGFVVATAAYAVLAFGVLGNLQKQSGTSPESYLGVAFLIMLPVALLLGGVVTELLSAPHIKSRLNHIFIAPGLYLAIAVAAVNVSMATLERSLGMALPCLLWFVASLAGVESGLFCRNRLSKYGRKPSIAGSNRQG